VFCTTGELFSQHPVWQQARNEAGGKPIFEGILAELLEREVFTFFKKKMVHFSGPSWSLCRKSVPTVR
jgi:hypothetical protein